MQLVKYAALVLSLALLGCDKLPAPICEPKCSDSEECVWYPWQGDFAAVCKPKDQPMPTPTPVPPTPMPPTPTPVPTATPTPVPTPTATPTPDDCRSRGCNPGFLCDLTRHGWACVQDQLPPTCEAGQESLKQCDSADSLCVADSCEPFGPFEARCGPYFEPEPGTIRWDCHYQSRTAGNCDCGHYLDGRCGRRVCEDPRGMRIQVISGGEFVRWCGEHTNDSGYCFDVRMTGGPVTVEACPSEPLRDREGKLMGRGTCRKKTYTRQEIRREIARQRALRGLR